MKILQSLKATLINSKKEEYEKKDGSKGCLYKVSIDQNGECGTLNTTEKIFEKMLDIPRFTEVVLTTEYNDQYRTFRVVDVYESN